jgi:hypothetical protein
MRFCMKIILVADGDTDYLFMEKVMSSDSELMNLSIELVKPEDVDLHRRTGGGHKTLLNDALHAAQKAAQGYADGVVVLVDNDGDPRFKFPHDNCAGCRECDARSTIHSVTWGNSFKKGASIVYQAVETIVLSCRQNFSADRENELVSDVLKTALYRRQIKNPEERYEAFKKEIGQFNISDVKARCYPRIKQMLKTVSQA